MEEAQHFDARLKEGVAYFEQMLKVMPNDRTTLEFLAVVYPQLGDQQKAEWALVELVRVLLQEGDLETATSLLPQLEALGDTAKAMAVRVRAAGEPRPELIPESTDIPLATMRQHSPFVEAVEAEAKLAERLGEPETAAALRALPDNGRLNLVSALSTLEREKPDACDSAISRMADETGNVPVPLDAFEPVRELAAKLPVELVRLRGVIPFAKLGSCALVVTLSPYDTELQRNVASALGVDTRFYLAEPRLVEAALIKLYPELEAKN